MKPPVVGLRWGPLGAVVLLVLSMVSLVAVPTAEASCHRTYPPCVCLKGVSLPCSETETNEMAGVAMTATMFMAEEEDHSGFVVFTFDWAGQASAAVPLSIEVDSPSVDWTDEQTATYVHGNDTTETDVRVYRHFVAEGEEIEMRFNVTAHQGTSEQESWTGTLHFEEGEGNGTATGEAAGLTETVVVAGVFGALIGALLVAVVMMVFRK